MVSPILGARTVEQLEDNLGALDIALDDGQVRTLEAASRIELGFPHDFLAEDYIQQMLRAGTRTPIGRNR